MTSVATTERAALADTLLAVGPDAPTLCGGWLARDLAAHVVLRERRPDAVLGIVARPLATYTASVQEGIAHRPWPELVQTLRSRSPLVAGPIDELVNSTEFYVHHEDVRRARAGWEPRAQDPRIEHAMWRILRSRGRGFFRRSPVGVVLELPDGTRHTVVDGAPSVVLHGPASELILYAYGRTSVAQVEVTGDADDVTAFSGTPLQV